MDIKHQVFVSSTFKDLIDERKEVIHALLELDCIPCGMELFPATDEDAWSLIKSVISECDYYILIIGGRYGSVNAKGISFTEMEYDYAVEIGKPIINFLHENIDELVSSKTESSDKGKERYTAFREKAESKHCKYWSSPSDLGGKVSRSLITLRKKCPSDGWVPGRFAADQKMLSEIGALQSRVIELEAITKLKNTAPDNIDELQHGSDTVRATFMLKKEPSNKKEEFPLIATWDDLFAYCGAALSGECSEGELQEKIELKYWHGVDSELRKFNQKRMFRLRKVKLDQIKVQFQALNLMEQGTKKRAVSDRLTYWKLTPYGERYYINYSARKRDLK